MSQSEEVNRREVAYRLFAAEFEDADFSYAESDEERAPNYVVTPTGARVNRLFVAGVLTEVEQVNEDVVRARVVDPTGAFVIYAGQYQPEALAALESADTPSFVAVTGKARTFQPDDSDVVYTSIRPEEVSEVDADTRDRWVVTAAEQTVDRVATMAAAHQRVERDDRLQQILKSAGVREGLAAGIPLALDHYETTPAYLDAVRTLALDAARVVAGDQEEVEELSLAPNDGGEAPLDFAADLDVPSDADESGPMETDPDAGTVDAEFQAEETEAETETEAEAEADSEGERVTDTAPDSEAAAETDTVEETPSPEPAAETPSPDEVAAEAKPDSESEEAETEPESEPADEGGDAAAEPSEPAAGDGEMYEMSEEERQEVEENFDVGFSSGDEIPEAGESDIDAPEPDEEPAADADETASTGDELGDFDAGESTEVEADAVGETDSEQPRDEGPEDGTSEEFTEDEYDESASDDEDEDAGSMDLDLEDYVVDLMSELDDGDGARREEVVATAADERDADEGEIEDAIQDALMSGRCYESGDDHLKAI